MDFENEITVEVDTDLENLIKILEGRGFKLKEVYDVNDIYLINKNDKVGDPLEILNKCKYKEYNEKKEITKQGKVKVKIDDIDKAKQLFENLGFEELIKINDHMLVYATDHEELVVQNVNNGKHIYIEVEDECHYADRTYNSIDELKEIITGNGIPFKNDNFFAKKAEIELKETYKGE